MSQELISLVKFLTANKNKKEIPQILKQHGFKQINQGSYKRVFKHPNWPDFVIKVYKPDGVNKKYNYFSRQSIADSTLPLPPELQRFWLNPIYRDNNLMIQAKAKRNKEAFDVIALNVPQQSDLWIYDINDNNCGFLNGRAVIFDYCVW